MISAKTGINEGYHLGTDNEYEVKKEAGLITHYVCDGYECHFKGTKTECEQWEGNRMGLYLNEIATSNRGITA